MKTHIKLYKVKKKWVTALVVSGITLSMGLGIGIVNQTTDVSAITIDPVNKKLAQNKAVVQSVPMDTANTQIKNILLANDGTDENWSPSLPTQSGLYGDYANSYANATIVNQNGKDYSIDYRVGPTTGQGTKYANYAKKSYDSIEQAQNVIKEQTPGKGSLSPEAPVDMGDSIPQQEINYNNHQGLYWRQKDYGVIIWDNNTSNNPISSQQIIDKIDSETLPQVYNQYGGSFRLDADMENNPNLGQKIFIRQGADVYTLSAHDPQVLFTMAGSLRYI